ncbi:MAG: hypothetical protein ABI999_16090 [Acidobacteriota bacterium]
MWTFFIIAIVIAAVLIVSRTTPWLSFRREPSEWQKKGALVGTLLKLNDSAFNDLMELYEKEFGPGPARYARRTYQKWQTGKVTAATQTYDRFLLQLPKVMSYDLKCEVLQHFLSEYAPKAEYSMDVTPDDWEEHLVPLLKQITDKVYTAKLPREVEEKLAWLSEGDMVAAEAILKASQAEQSKITVSKLDEEFVALKRILAETKLKAKVTHVIKLPYGSIKLKIKRS